MIKFGVIANTHPLPGTDLQRMVDELIAEAQQAERYGFDIISKGRLILGVGMGYQPGDFAAYGLKVSERVSLFEEAIEILKRAWTEEKVSFVGKRFTLANVAVTPKPVQKPHPPIWIAAVGDEAMKRAGRLGDALLADSFQLPDRLKRRVDLYRATAESRGRPHTVVLFREGFVAESRDKAIQEYEAGLLSTHRYYWRHGAYYQDIKKEEDLDLKRISLKRLILGSPQDCIDMVRMWNREIGADYILIRFRHPAGPAHAKVLNALQLFGEEVIPTLQ
jgi:alkanesulfonate monooxygenase SsuD/methylene tetrahydromethanopterin reductase-like flavin-dependent oxidoreductase (luciferase family)